MGILSIVPIIGMTYSDMAVRDEQMKVRTYCTRKYYVSLQQAGAQVILLPPTKDENCFAKYLEIVDGILLPGGEDVDPRYQGEDPHQSLGIVNPLRDEYEILLVKKAAAQGIPVLGICRGIQVLAMALGGSIHQDLLGIQNIQHEQNAPRWAPSHKVELKKNSRLASWLAADNLYTNSFHHQAVRDVPEGFRISGWTSDGVVESIEHEELCLVGVQWHPEEMSHCEVLAARIFQEFVNDVKKG